MSHEILANQRQGAWPGAVHHRILVWDWSTRRGCLSATTDLQSVTRTLCQDAMMGRVMIVVVDCQTDVNARRIITSVGDFLFKHGVVTWCRVISLLAVAAAVATECSQAGHTQLIPAVVAAVTDVIERHAASWISQQGGWVCRIIFSTSCVESQCCVSVRHIVVRPATSCFADWSKRRHVTEHYRMTDDSRSRSRDN